MRTILERLATGEVLLCDGAMGTMLFQHGLPMGQCPEALNLEKPEILEAIARQYFEAGADMIETNTFGGTPLKLAGYGLDHKTEEINAAAVRIVRGVVGDRALVAASCGPSGKLLKPYGDTEPAEIQASFERQIASLFGAGADLICIETMTDLTEAVLAVKAARTVAPSLPVVATMTFDSTPNGFFTIMGITVERAARELAAAGADIVGSNCGNGIDAMVAIADEFLRNTKLPVMIQSNAGLPVLCDGQAVYAESPVFMAERVPRLLDLGVRIIGGCCGTTPDHIAAFRRAIDRRGRQ
jgi:5-methyltetrahydrofolate--homocysteine methyltransferase